MRTILASVFILLLTFGLSINDAAARGFGGGRGFSAHRSHSVFSNFSRNKNTNRATSSNRASPSKWRGAFTGMMIGGLLASLFMGHGFGSAVLSWMVLGFLLMLVVNFVRRRQYEKYGSVKDTRGR